jgi:hypothetical protein
VKDAAEGPNIDSEGGLLTSEELWWHVVQRPGISFLQHAVSGSQNLCHSEITDLYFALLCEKDVFRFEVLV